MTIGRWFTKKHQKHTRYRIAIHELLAFLSSHKNRLLLLHEVIIAASGTIISQRAMHFKAIQRVKKMTICDCDLSRYYGTTGKWFSNLSQVTCCGTDSHSEFVHLASNGSQPTHAKSSLNCINSLFNLPNHV